LQQQRRQRRQGRQAVQAASPTAQRLSSEMGVGRTTGMVELCTKILQIMCTALED